MPTPSLAAIRPWLMLLRQDRDLPTIQKLKEKQKHLISNTINRDHSLWRWRRISPTATRIRTQNRTESRIKNRPTRGVGAAKELPKEEAASGEDAAVGVDEAALNAEGDITEGLAVDEKVKVIEGERS